MSLISNLQHQLITAIDVPSLTFQRALPAALRSDLLRLGRAEHEGNEDDGSKFEIVRVRQYFRTWYGAVESFIERLLHACDSDIIGDGTRAPSSLPLFLQWQHKRQLGDHRFHQRVLDTISDPACPLVNDLAWDTVMREFYRARDLRNECAKPGMTRADARHWVQCFGTTDFDRMFKTMVFALEQALDTAVRLHYGLVSVQLSFDLFFEFYVAFGSMVLPSSALLWLLPTMLVYCCRAWC